jgi:hypothetical protein
MAGTEEWFRPNRRILKRGSDGGRGSRSKFESGYLALR